MATMTIPQSFPASGGGQYEPIPADNHIGLCVGVLDMGTHMESFKGEPPVPKEKIRLLFELPGVTRSDGQPAVIGVTHNFSLNEKANFRKMLDQWLGADWHDRLKGKTWRELCGIPAMVNVASGPSKRDPSRVVSWIEGVSRFPKGLAVPEGKKEHLYLDLKAKLLPAELSPYDAQTIRDSLEYQRGGFEDQAPTPKPQSSFASASAPTNHASLPPSNAAETFRPAVAKGCPPHVAGVLARLGMTWPYRIDDYPHEITDADIATLEPYALPF